MRHCFLALSLLSFPYILFSQTVAKYLDSSYHAGKPIVDTATFFRWTSLHENAVISNDGNYVLYNIKESSALPILLLIQAIDGKWRTESQISGNAIFTEDSRKVIFIKPQDSLCVFDLEIKNAVSISGVTSFQRFDLGKEEYIAYKLNTQDKGLVLRNLMTGKEQSFVNVSSYLISSNGECLVLNKESNVNGGTAQSIEWLNLENGSHAIIRHGINAANASLSNAGTQVVFMINNNRGCSSLWYYKNGMDSAVEIMNDQSAEIDKDLRLNSVLNFSKDGGIAFITLKDRDSVPPQNAIAVDVWSSSDAKLQSQQLAELKSPGVYLAAMNVGDGRIIRLQQENDHSVDIKTDSFVCVRHSDGDNFREGHWNPAAQYTSYLISTRTGERKRLKFNIAIQISPDGRFIIGKNSLWSDLYSYELETGIIRNLTKALPIPITDILKRDENDRPYAKLYRGLEFRCWLKDRGNMLIYDDFDIWEVDPSGKKRGVNITNGYGRRNQIVFRLSDMYPNIVPVSNETLVANALNKSNKKAGFYRVAVTRNKDPELLHMGDYLYYNDVFNSYSQSKAKNVGVYIIKRESCKESPNYFCTRDFKSFIPLSGVAPEKHYNWMTSELLKFKTLDGRSEQGILYKPEDFNPRKKYPVIIHYYERQSRNLNKYHKPNEIGGIGLDISWFVSHEYLVVIPDIHFKMGETGLSAYNSIVGIARSMVRYPWVDVKHIGIQGHSFGGYETNYVVTHTRLFAAAVSSSGPVDFVSGYGSIMGTGYSAQWLYEESQNRIGATLWQRPDLYIKNSPIFQADKVSTPILTIANQLDRNVPFQQGVEWFTALRRLGKRAWMLQYDGQGHGLAGKASVDYIIRTTQFFDHYLKGSPPPRWMTRGIRASRKGIDTGYELDTSGRVP